MLFRSYLNGQVVFPTFFNLSLNMAIRSSWSEPVSSRSCFCWLYRASPSLAAKYIINLILVLTIWWCPCIESSLDHLVMSMYRVFSCVVGIGNEAGQRLIEFCQENALVIANTLFQQHKRRLYTWKSPDGQHQIRLCSLQPKMKKLYTGNNNNNKKTRSWLWLRSWTPYCQIQT